MDTAALESAHSSLQSSRLCSYSQCRRPLPPSTGGRRPEYCPDRRWGEEGNISCKKAGQAEQVLIVAQGSLALGDAVLADLREVLGAAAEPVQQLSTVLEEVRTEIGERAEAALAEASQGRTAAAEAEGRARSAEDASVAALRAQQESESAQQAAEQRAREAEGVADRAQREAAAEREGAAVARGAVERLEIDNDRLRAEAAEAQSSANTEAARAERAEAQYQASAEELDRLRARVETAQREWADERTRLTDQMNRVSTDYAVRLEELQQSHTQAQERTARDHAEQIADLQRQLGHAEARAQDHVQTGAELQRLRRSCRQALIALQENRPTSQVRELLEHHMVDNDRESAGEGSGEQVQRAVQALTRIVDIDGRVLQLCTEALDHHDGVLAEGVLPERVMDDLSQEGLLQRGSRTLTSLAQEAIFRTNEVEAERQRW